MKATNRHSLAALLALFSGLALGLTHAASASDKAPEKPAEKTQTVPFELLPSRHILVKVTINGKGPFGLIYDTGAPINLVSSKLAKESGLTQKSGGGFLGSLFGGPQEVNIQKLAIGDVQIEKVPAVVMDHPTVQAISKFSQKEFGPIEGIVGYSFFARYATTIDYQKKQIDLVKTDHEPGNFMADLPQRIQRLAADSKKTPVVAPAGLWGLAVDKPDEDKKPGMTIATVTANGPAAKAGIQRGDRLLSLDGRWTDTLPDFLDALQRIPHGQEVEAVIQRAGKELKIKLTPLQGV